MTLSAANEAVRQPPTRSRLLVKGAGRYKGLPAGDVWQTAKFVAMKQQQLFESEPLPWVLADRDDLLCAHVVFNRPVDTVFDYVIPDHLRAQVQAGQRVKVPFGRADQLTVGYCIG
ncbi:MAG: hypothetical protein ACT4QC_14775, partial [Planctomycetaceae bacterium]